MVVSVALVGCMQQQALIDDLYTPDQWAALKASFAVDPAKLDQCSSPIGPIVGQCDDYARLGQEVFFDPALSGNGKIACTTCHDPKNDFVDTRPGMNVSVGATTTKHNALTLVNIVVKETLTEEQRLPAFTWIGSVNTNQANAYAGDVFKDLALKNAMAGTPLTVRMAIVAHHLDAYRKVFPSDAFIDDDATLANVELALDIYERQLISLDSPFDHYINGDDTALDAGQEHGFELFVGKAACSECHAGPLLSKLEFHSNGIDQNAPNLIEVDPGREKITGSPDDFGLFLTPPLRNVAMTKPYMHGGQLASLEDVANFYWTGGGSLPTKDPRIQSLVKSDQNPDGLDPDDVADLVEFLRALTGTPVDAKYTSVDTNGHVTW